MQTVKSKKLGASGSVYTGKCFLATVLIGMDEANDAVVTAYDGVDNTGNELIPTNKYDASALGLNGVVLQFMVECWEGIYIEITCSGTCEIVTHYAEDARKGVG